MGMVEKLQSRNYASRRVHELARLAAALLPADARVLDVGCGDGFVDKLIMERRPDVQIEGCDVVAWEGAHIPVSMYDGDRLPYDDNAFDAVMLIDVIHHAEDMDRLMQDVVRVAAHHIVIKDHLADRRFSVPILKWMDDVGNRRHGVNLPYCYLTTPQWQELLSRHGIESEEWITNMRLYPLWAEPFLGKGLHFFLKGKIT